MTATKARPIPSKWRKLFRLIPGYDPVRDAAGCWFDAAEAERYVAFIEECCHHTEGDLAGEPFLLEPWQKAVVGCLFGWKRLDEYGRIVRRYRTCLLYIARGNGKTPLAAAIALAVLMLDDDPKAQIIGAAADAKQAAHVFRHAAGMVALEPELSSRLKIFGAAPAAVIKSIVYEQMGSSYNVVSATAGGKHGYNLSLGLVDELHMVHRDLVDALRSGLVKKTRAQPLLMYMTTADEERESVCNDVYNYACQVRDGLLKDASFLPIVFEVGKDDDWTSPKVWRKANPNIGVSVSEESLQRICDEAQTSPSVEVAFKRFNLNLRVSSVSRAISMDRWRACGKNADPKRWRAEAIERLEGRRCFAGLDVGSVSDLNAFVLLFPDDDEPRHITLLPWFWIPEGTVAKRDAQHRPLMEHWIQDGWIIGMPGDTPDYLPMHHDITEICKPFEVVDIAVDRAFQGMQLCSWLMADKFEVYEFGQGWQSMAGPTKDFIERVTGGFVEHGNNPVLSWMASNVCVQTGPAGILKPVKPRNAMSPLKIDGIVASIMALGRMALVEADTARKSAERTESYIRKGRGIVVI